LATTSLLVNTHVTLFFPARLGSRPPLAQSSGGDAASWDALRTLRMFGFGLAWYGPYQVGEIG
jgi:hypothetical protein